MPKTPPEFLQILLGFSAPLGSAPPGIRSAPAEKKNGKPEQSDLYAVSDDAAANMISEAEGSTALTGAYVIAKSWRLDAFEALDEVTASEDLRHAVSTQATTPSRNAPTPIADSLPLPLIC